MPSMSADDDEVFWNPARSPCTGMGIVAETFWARPGVLRSDSPHAFAASGPRAAAITAAHPIEVPHAARQPGRARARARRLHPAARCRTRRRHDDPSGGEPCRRSLPPASAGIAGDGGRDAAVRQLTGEPDHCCERFALLDDWLDARGAQRRGTESASARASCAFAGCGRRRARAAAAGRDRLPASARALRRVRRRARESHQF